jgi:hypothetical protein
MADGGNVLKFPSPNAAPIIAGGGAALKLASKKPRECILPPPPPLDSYKYEDAVDLFDIAKTIKKKAGELISYVDDNRGAARKAGIEVLTVQIGSILEGGRFQRVYDALEEAVQNQTSVTLTREGVDKLNRLERLMAEADGIVVGYVGGGKRIGRALGSDYGPEPSDISKWIPVLIIGIAGIVGVIAILAMSQKSRNS